MTATSQLAEGRLLDFPGQGLQGVPGVDGDGPAPGPPSAGDT
jgi:hypothetical protein